MRESLKIPTVYQGAYHWYYLYNNPNLHCLLIKYTYSFYLLSESLVLNNQNMDKDGFIVLRDSNEVNITAVKGAELFMIKSSSNVDYKRYID